MGVRRHIAHANGERIPYPVEVRTNAHGVNARNAGQVVDVVEHMLQGGPEIGVFLGIGSAPGLRGFAISCLPALP